MATSGTTSSTGGPMPSPVTSTATAPPEASVSAISVAVIVPATRGRNSSSIVQEPDAGSGVAVQVSSTMANGLSRDGSIRSAPTLTRSDPGLLRVTVAVLRPAAAIVSAKRTSVVSNVGGGSGADAVPVDDVPVRGGLVGGGDEGRRSGGGKLNSGAAVPIGTVDCGGDVDVTDGSAGPLLSESVVVGPLVVGPLVVGPLVVGPLVVGSVAGGSVVVVVVVTSGIEPSGRRSAIHTCSPTAKRSSSVRMGPASLSNTTQRPCCEMPGRLSGATAATSTSVVTAKGVPDIQVVRTTAPPRVCTTWRPSAEITGCRASDARTPVPSPRSSITTNGAVTASGSSPTAARSVLDDSNISSCPSADSDGAVESAAPGVPVAVIEARSTVGVPEEIDHTYTLAGSGSNGTPPAPAAKARVAPSADRATASWVTMSSDVGSPGSVGVSAGSPAASPDETAGGVASMRSVTPQVPVAGSSS